MVRAPATEAGATRGPEAIEAIAGHLALGTGVDEVFDVQVLPGVVFP
jgi:hypothetical protein